MSRGMTHSVARAARGVLAPALAKCLAKRSRTATPSRQARSQEDNYRNDYVTVR